MRKTAALFAFVVSASGCARSTPEPVLLPAAGPDPAVVPGAGHVADLSWMAGSWLGAQGAGTFEEHWTSPGGGTMLGVGRVVAADETLFFEFMRIIEDEKGVVFVAMPKGKVEVAFRLVESGPGRAVFENLTHDSPVRISYHLSGSGQLVARTEGREGDSRDFPMDRISPAPAKAAPPAGG